MRDGRGPVCERGEASGLFDMNDRVTPDEEKSVFNGFKGMIADWVYMVADCRFAVFIQNI